MKKKKSLTTLSLVLVAIVSGFGGLNAYQSQVGEIVCLLSADGIEALTGCESRDGYPMRGCIESKKEKCYIADFIADGCISNRV